MFAHPDAMKYIKLAREMFFNVIGYSNKSMLNKHSIKTLSNLYIDYISCTIANYCTQCPGIALSESGNSRNCSEICKKTALARSFVYASIP